MKKRYLLLCLLACCGLLALTGCGEDPGDTTAKPVLYLYPEEETTVNVQLDYTGQLTTTYPAYGDGWTVTAGVDKTICNGNLVYTASSRNINKTPIPPCQEDYL